MPEHRHSPSPCPDGAVNEKVVEVSLEDMLGIVWRNKWVVGLLLLLGVGVGIWWPSNDTPIYAYWGVLEIGQHTVNNQRQLIEEPSAVVAKLQRSYIPLAEEALPRGEEQQAASATFSVSNPKDSRLIVIQANGPSTASKAILSIEDQVLRRVVKDHARITGVPKRALEATLAKAEADLANRVDSKGIIGRELQRAQQNFERKLSGLHDARKMLTNKLSRISDLESLTKSRIANLEELIANAQKNRREATKNDPDQSTAMDLLLLDNELFQQTDKLAELKRRLFVDLKNEQDQIQNWLDDNSRREADLRTAFASKTDELNYKLAENSEAQMAQRASIANIKYQIDNTDSTRILNNPTQSLNAIKPRRKRDAVLGALLGLCGGLGAAVLLEILRRRRSPA